MGLPCGWRFNPDASGSELGRFGPPVGGAGQCEQIFQVSSVGALFWLLFWASKKVTKHPVRQITRAKE